MEAAHSTETSVPVYQTTRRIREVFGSNFGRDADLRGFPQLLEPDGGIAPRLGHDCFLPNPFQFTLSTLYSLTAEGVVK
jgi:hypothetical protein